MSDSTTGGTVMVKDIFVGSESSFIYEPFELVDVNGDLFFYADDGVHGKELWKSDGVADGTVMVKDINPGNYGSAGGEFTVVNGKLFFRAADGIHGDELWKSDGTSDGTVLVKDIRAGIGWSGPGELTDVNGMLFFSANDGVHGSELWKSDGAAEGTVLVKDVYPGSDGSGTSFLTEVNGTLFFSADDGVHGSELWKSDGTADGTEMVKDIYPGGNGSGPSVLTSVNGTLFFSADGGVHGSELWKSDGTADGTVLVKDISPGSDTSWPEELIDVNGALFFSAYDGVHGRELWKSDSTADGTVLVKDINPGGDGSGPGWFTYVNGTLFFEAEDGVHGEELWKSDGTAGGTQLVKDIYLGGDGALSWPGWLTAVNGTLFFTADDGIHGRELWALDATGGASLWFEPPEATWPVGSDFTIDIMVAEVSDLYGVELQLSFDPTIVEVVDVDPVTAGIQIQPGVCPMPDSVDVNSADNTTGTISYAVTSLSPSPPCNSGGVIASITFLGLTEGNSILHFEGELLSDTNANPIPVDSVQDGSLTVMPIGILAGTVDLQGRSNESGAEVCAWQSGVEVECTTTDAAGSYAFSLSDGTCDITAEMALYLDAEKSGVTVVSGETNTLCQVILLCGDANDDDIINILDLSFMGFRFGLCEGDLDWDPRADCNNDGCGNILDITGAGVNFNKFSPVPWLCP
jgi:ELWxxDGT repeat protein